MTTPHRDDCPFIGGKDLYQRFCAGERMTILDSHWAKAENSAWDAYVSRHIPGSMFCNPLTQLASVPSREHGRNPLPLPEALQRSLDDWGIVRGRPVYIYDAGRNVFAARAWWILRWAGVEDVRILHGGTGQWVAAGGDVAGGIGALRGRGNVQVKPGCMPVIEMDEIPDCLDRGVLVDAREESRFSGRKEHFDHQAGHIPGAVNLPVFDFFDDAGVVLPDEVVREKFAEYGVTSGEDVAVYSGSGVHSSLLIAVMEHAGLSGARHYVGGWSQWSADSSRPIERG